MPNTIPSGQLIKMLHDRLEKIANNTLREKDLTMMQISVLMELQKAEQKQRSMKELERKFCVAQSTVAGIISRLEQKRFVEAVGDASDKRIKPHGGDALLQQRLLHEAVQYPQEIQDQFRGMSA